VLSDAILLRAMVPLAATQPADLTGKRALIICGARDAIVPAASAARLADLLRGAGVAVDHRVLPVGHGISSMDLTLVSQSLNEGMGIDGGVLASVSGS
jgi:phospholipase/carboxylesterase